MKATKSLIVYGGVLLLGMTIATQWAAARMPASALGWHVSLLGKAFYPPWSVFTWQRKLIATFPRVFQSALAIVAFHAVLAAFLALSLNMHRPTVRPMGKERWGTLRDMQRAGLLRGAGTIVGRFRGRLLTYGGPENQMVVGPPRSGKGTGHVIPTLLACRDSALAFDIKRELWAATAGLRSRFSHCLFFDPTHSCSARFNPLLEIRKGPNEIRDTQNIVEMLVNPDGSKEQLDIWDQHSSQLLTALILHVAYTQPDDRKHLGVVRDCLLDWSGTFRDMIELPHRLNPSTGAPEPHPEVAHVSAELMKQAPRFAAGVRATALGHLALYADPVICRNIAVSDFLASDLVCSESPMTLYLQPPPSDLPRLRPLMRLLINQICRASLERLDADNRGRPKRHKLLLELDEFATLGRMDFFTTNLRQMTGYGIKAHIIVQSFNDLVEKYGLHNSLIDNTHAIVVFACSDTLTAERVSKMSGTIVEYRESYARKHWLRFFPESVQQSEHLRPLLQPGDVRMLRGDEQLLFVTGHPPMRTKKIRYYADREFKKLLFDPPDQSLGVDTPRCSDAKLGVPHDWLGERAKAPRMHSEEIFDMPSDQEWMPVVDGPAPGLTTQPGKEDAYGL